MPTIMPSEVYELNVAAPGSGADVDGKEDNTLQKLVAHAVEEALSWKEEYVDEEMEKATDYYMGRPYGDEREGRSQIVTTEVRDAVARTMPSLLRVFTASERVVEFKPKDADDVQTADQQTETVNYVFNSVNPGFLILHSVFKDALVRKLGIAKWFFAEKDEVLGSEHTGLTAEDVAILQRDPDHEVEVLDEYEIEYEVPGPEGPQLTREPRFDVALTRTVRQGKACVEAVPPEEFIWSPNAKSLDDAIMAGHVREVPASELVAMGYDRELVDERKGSGVEIHENELARARRLDEEEEGLYEDTSDESMRPVKFCEVYIRFDSDDDGIAEIHKVHAIGDDYYVVEDEIVDHVPFALFRVDPEPHTLVGLSQADYVMDLQRIISHVMRGTLDSLVSHLNPAMEVVEGEVSMKDVENQELGRIIRVRRPGMVREITTQFVGAAALPVLTNLQEQVSGRVGVNAMTDGLEPDAMQSTTAVGVAATVEAGKQRTEMMVRMLAETGMRDLFKGLLRTLVQHQDDAMVIRLRGGEFTRVDPRHWEADKDVVVNVALGTGLVEEKIQRLLQIAAKQEQHMQQGSPLVDFVTLRATYARMIELMGFANADAFFKPFGPEQQQQFAEQQAQNRQPSDNEVLKEIEMAKLQARQQEKMLEMQMRQAELAFQREKVQAELALKGQEVNLKIASEQASQALERAKAAVDAQMSQLQGLKLLADTRIGEE